MFNDDAHQKRLKKLYKIFNTASIVGIVGTLAEMGFYNHDYRIIVGTAAVGILSHLTAQIIRCDMDNDDDDDGRDPEQFDPVDPGGHGKDIPIDPSLLDWDPKNTLPKIKEPQFA